MFYEKFEALCRQFKLDPVSADGDLANVFFNLGVKFALKEQTSIPSLLVGCDQAVDFKGHSFDQIVFDDLSANDPDDLTQADIQSLSSALNKILNSFENHLQVCDANINTLWELCDINRKDDPEVKQYYAMLNNWKANKLEIKEKYKKFAAIQRKLKIIMKFA